MMDILNYIKNIFTTALEPTRKRRAPFEEPDNSLKKIRRLSSSQMSSNEDDWVSLSSASSSLRRRGALHPVESKPHANDVKYKIKWTKNEPSITLDDEDDEFMKPNSSKKVFKSTKFTSTPNNFRKKNEEIIKVSEFPFDKKLMPKRQGFEYAKPYMSLFQDSTSAVKISQNGTYHQNHASPIFGGCKDKKSKYALVKTPSPRSAALDQSFRLDEKRKYKELLSKAAPSLLDAFAEYSTPASRIFGCGGNSRGKRMVEIARTPKSPKSMGFIDLTNGNKNYNRLSTKDTIKKVLSNFHSDVVEVRDTDSDIEVLPSPPTPEPDIKVDRVNSLKVFVDPCEPVHDDWIANLLRSHNDLINKRQREITEQTAQKSKFSEINTEIRIRKLDEDVKKVLHIKDVILPIEAPQEKLPALTDEQELKVKVGFDRRASEGEVLMNKFNLNISRRDILTLQGLNWLNDEVINFYMNLIIERAKDQKWPKTYAMNTFFYPKIVKDGYGSVRRWTKKVDLYAYDLIVVPIHLSVHWCLAVIDFRSRSVKFYDSMGSSNDKCLKVLLNYIQQEHQDKKKSKFDVSDWELKNMQDIPQQMNGSDCGMFSCTLAEFLSRDAKITFSQEDMPYLRRKMVVEILEGRLLIS